MAIGNKHKKFGEDKTCSSEDVITDRHIHTHRHTNSDTHMLITILCSPHQEQSNKPAKTGPLVYTNMMASI